MRGCASGLWNSLTPTLVVVFMAVVFMVVFIMLVFMVVFIMLVFMVVFIMLVFIVIFLSTPPFRTPLHRFIWVLTLAGETNMRNMKTPRSRFSTLVL